MEEPSSYHLGAAWSESQKRFGGDFNHELPWTDDYAEQVFNGEIKQVRNFYQLAVLKGSLDAPEAVAVFQEQGRFVKVDFLDTAFRPELSYRFMTFGTAHDPEWDPSHGGQRPEHLFCQVVDSIGYVEGQENASRAAKSFFLQRYFSLRGMTRYKDKLVGSSLPSRFDWHVDPEVDVSGDGFWEPVATFGDWDRWFVRDRPGVKLFD